MTSPDTERTLTELDHVRLKNLVQRHRQSGEPPELVDALEHLLDDAALVASTRVLPDVVTMYSTVVLRDTTTDHRTTLTVCYPPDAEPDKGFVSALSPVGGSVLGRRVGEVIRWHTPAGEPRAAEIVAILFQPEASGDLTL